MIPAELDDIVGEDDDRCAECRFGRFSRSRCS